MSIPAGFIETEQLFNIPAIDGLSYALMEPEAQAGDDHADAYVVGRAEDGSGKALAFIDGLTGETYRCDCIANDDEGTPASRGEEPLVKMVGSFEDETGQIVIKQPEGHWRRYSRWDRIKKAPPTQPAAVVRTLPQCGCGGYLGAPMMFDSFKEMLAYFFVVFSDAESVNAKHAAILTGDSCAI